MISAQQKQQNIEGDRYAPMLKLANELGKQQLSENKKRKQAPWTAEKRAQQSHKIKHLQPWKKACGPKTAAGKARASQNAYKHGLRSADYVAICQLLKVQRDYVRDVHRNTFENIRDLEDFYAKQTAMTSINEKAKQIKRFLGSEGFSVPARDIKHMIQAVTGHDEADMITNPDAPITVEQEKQLDEIAARYKAGEPLTRILGVREFWGLEFEVTPDTLDPRPDTETLVEAALAYLKAHPKNQPSTSHPAACGHGDFKILDMGTGTGCILIALLSELPNAVGVAADISPKALEVARRNAQKYDKQHKMSSRIDFVESDWMGALQGEQFDLIVSNPPYIVESVIDDLDVEVKNHDPILALSGGDDGLDCYKKIIFDLKKHLNSQNRAFLEIGFDQLKTVTGIVEESNLCVCDSYADLSGIPRVVEISNGDK